MAQLSLPLIERQHENTLIRQRAKDGYINATAMCQAAGRPWSRYWEVKASKEFAKALSDDLGIPISELIQSVSGGTPELQGTWVHPQVSKGKHQARVGVQAGYTGLDGQEIRVLIQRHRGELVLNQQAFRLRQDGQSPSRIADVGRLGE